MDRIWWEKVPNAMAFIRDITESTLRKHIYARHYSNILDVLDKHLKELKFADIEYISYKKYKKIKKL